MNNKHVFFLSIAAVFIVAAILATYSASATSVMREQVRGERAIQAETQRWEAMAEYYAKLPVPVTGAALTRANSADAARLQGQAIAYLAAVERIQQAYAERWQGQADAYRAMQQSQQVYAKRWQGQADAYLAAMQRAQQAYGARWQGQADAYRAARLRAQQADAARWQAMADYYLKNK